MRASYFGCLALTLLALASYAEEMPGQPVTDFSVLTVYEIPGKYTEMPINITMPDHWDGDQSRIRVKAIYRDDSSHFGISATHLTPSQASTEMIDAHDGSKTMRIVVDDNNMEIYYLHVVFRNKAGTVCK